MTRCMECKFWAGLDPDPAAGLGNDTGCGLCRVQAPLPFRDFDKPMGHPFRARAAWPVTAPDDWCGRAVAAKGSRSR
ncbi:hypothetical protein HN937_23840 [Candidatus Poribacteria bacterium]|jgi:hypothetical protein|nr:hypothetical protein [Candidatus Poribacteria bacterium]